MIASQRGHKDVVEKLLQNGARKDLLYEVIKITSYIRSMHM